MSSSSTTIMGTTDTYGELTNPPNGSFQSLIDSTMKGALLIGALIALLTYGITISQVRDSSALPSSKKSYKQSNVISNGVDTFLLYVVSKR
jgi:hypothetical protein